MVERYTIEDVANIHGLQELSRRNGEVYCVCPNCGNVKKKFSYVIAKNDKKDIFHCWSCGVGGNATDLHVLLSGKNFCSTREAARDIFMILNGNNEYQTFHKKSVKRQKEIETEKPSNKKSEEYCSKVYFKLLKCLDLQDKHRENLKHRGLSDADIDAYKFKSMPSKKKGIAICKALSKMFDLEGVPGFFYENGTWDMFHAEGYLCPAYDGQKNLLLGFQVRLDEPIEKTKYLWFSSTNKEKGCSSGAISSYLPGKGTAVLVIEGILKAHIVYCRLKCQCTIIGVPGTKAIKCMPKYLKRNKFSVCFEAYDMDKAKRVSSTDKKIERILQFIQADRQKTKSSPDAYELVRENEKTILYRKDGARKDVLKRFKCQIDMEQFEKDFHEAKKTLRLAEDSDKMKMLVSQYKIPVKSIKWNLDDDGFWKEEYKGLDDYILNEDNLNNMMNFIEKVAFQLSTK